MSEEAALAEAERWRRLNVLEFVAVGEARSPFLAVDWIRFEHVEAGQ